MAHQRRSFFSKIIFLTLTVFFLVGWQYTDISYTEQEQEIADFFANYAAENNLTSLETNPALIAAAREYVGYLKKQEAKKVYDDVLNKILYKHGIYDFNMPVIVYKKKELPASRLLDERLKNILKRENFNMLGLTVFREDPARDIIVLLFGKREVYLNEIPLVVKERTVKLSGKMNSGIYNGRILVMTPAKNIYEYKLNDEQRFFEKTLKLPELHGKYIFQIVAEDLSGVKSLALFPVYYGVSPEQERAADYALASVKEYSAAEAEEFLSAEINRLRRERGLPLLINDQQLSKTAAARSIKMAGLSSPSHAYISVYKESERELKKAAVSYGLLAENFFAGNYLVLLHEKRLDIPYYVQNLFKPDLREIGVGVSVVTDAADQTYYYVTELMVNKDNKYVNLQQKNKLIEMINAKRKSAQLPPLVNALEYSSLAQQHAEKMAAYDLLDYLVDPQDKHLGEQYRKIEGLRTTAVRVYAARDLADLITNDVYDETFNKIAVGLAVSDSPKYGESALWVVLVFIDDRAN